MSFVYITEEGVRIQKKGGKFVVGRNLEVVFEIPEETLEGLVLIDSVQISSKAMTSFLEIGVPVTWLSRTGKFFGRLESTKHIHVFRQAKQIEVQNKPFALDLGKQIIAAKVHNQLTILRRYNRRIESKAIEKQIKNILAVRKNIFMADSKEQLMGYEGMIARLYFEGLGKLVPEEFTFNKRTRQPPLDAVNSMLSFGYTLLMYEIYTAISNQGLHPYFGILHALKNHHPALASDLLEEWRAVIVDSMVLSLIHHHEILPENFQKDEETGGIYIDRDGRKIFLKAYEKKMRTVNQYMEIKNSYRYSLRQQAASFAEALMCENSEIYEPVLLR